MTIELHTWDYVALMSALHGGLAPRRLDEHDTDRPHLLAAGFIVPKVETPEPKTQWDKPKKRTVFHITDEGRAWLKKVQERWEEQVQGKAWWRLGTNMGTLIIGIPDFLHPEEAEPDLRHLFGSSFAFAQPHEDRSRGNPYKFDKKRAPLLDGTVGETPWRPWHDAAQAWVDATEENGAHWRGAYMRLHGAPLDPALSFMEACGLFVPGSHTIDEGLAMRLSLLDTVTAKASA